MAPDAAVETPPAAGQATAAPVAASAEPRRPKAATASAPDGGKKAVKAGKGAKGKAVKGAKGKAAKGDEANREGPSVAAHPRAARGVARAKSWGGLVGFLLGGYLSLPTNTLADAGLRALLAGIICYVAVWAAAVFLWRRLVMLEIKGREQQLLEASRAVAGARRESPAASVERSSARAAS
jgi:hypothetical protein